MSKLVAFGVATSILTTILALMAGELAVRFIDGFAVSSLNLKPSASHVPAPPVGSTALPAHVEAVKRAPDVETTWFSKDPPPPNPAAARDSELEKRYWENRGRELPSIYVWNAQYVREEACRNRGDFIGLQEAYVYDPVRNTPFPRYRFFPGRVLPSKLVTNSFGWRGPELTLQKPPATIRIAFVGASTTVNPHSFRFSYPEYVGAWLNVWAQERKLPVRFEIINAGREGTNSNDFAAVVRDELVPMEPDLVVYYEGSNQFWPADFVEWPDGKLPAKPKLTFSPSWIEQHSAIWRRVQTLVASASGNLRKELPRSFGKVNWPADLDEMDPDLRHPRLPLNLKTILSDLDAIRAALQGSNAELVLSSFVWLAYDEMVIDIARHPFIFLYLNETFWPFPYSHMRRMADFQNRAFSKYASRHGIDFLDIAGQYPQDLEMFDDAVHMNRDGVRLHAWIAVNSLIPLLESRIRAGILPRAGRSKLKEHPVLSVPPKLVQVDRITSDCPPPSQ